MNLISDRQSQGRKPGVCGQTVFPPLLHPAPALAHPSCRLASHSFPSVTSVSCSVASTVSFTPLFSWLLLLSLPPLFLPPPPPPPSSAPSQDLEEQAGVCGGSLGDSQRLPFYPRGPGCLCKRRQGEAASQLHVASEAEGPVGPPVREQPGPWGRSH